MTSISLPTTEREDLSKAINLIEKGTKQDPDFALGYCLIAKAHDSLYSDLIDHSPERRAFGDAAVNEALRLRPDLPEAHLAAAFHLYACYQDFEKARVHIAIAAQAGSNSSDLLSLTATIDQVQGRWKEATMNLEKAVSLDPRNPELLESLAHHFSNLRRFREAGQLRKSLIDMYPDQPLFFLNRADALFCGNGDLKSVLAAYEATPASMKDDLQIRNQLGYYAMCARDFKTAHEIVNKSSNEEIYFGFATVPSRCADIWLELVQYNHPSIDKFRTTHEQLFQKIIADPTNAILLSAASCIDIALGRKEEAVLVPRAILWEYHALVEPQLDSAARGRPNFSTTQWGLVVAASTEGIADAPHCLGGALSPFLLSSLRLNAAYNDKDLDQSRSAISIYVKLCPGFLGRMRHQTFIHTMTYATA